MISCEHQTGIEGNHCNRLGMPIRYKNVGITNCNHFLREAKDLNSYKNILDMEQDKMVKILKSDFKDCMETVKEYKCLVCKENAENSDEDVEVKTTETRDEMFLHLTEDHTPKEVINFLMEDE